MPTSQHHIATSASGDDLFDVTFRRYFKSLCYYAKQFLPPEYDPADLVMAGFLKVLENRKAVRNPEAISGYLYTTVRNECFQVLRKKSIKVSSLEISEADHPSEPALDALQMLIRSETIRLLHEQADQLPQHLKEIFRQYFVEGKSEHDISDALGRPYHTVRGQRRRVVEILRAKLKLK